MAVSVGVVYGMVGWVLLAVLLLVATGYDIRFRRIPNWLTLLGCVAGLLFATVHGGIAGLLESGKGLLLAFAIGLPFWLLGWMGAGDVKLVSAVGAFVGGGLVVNTLLAIGIAGAGLAIVALLWRGVLSRTGERMMATLGLSVASRRWMYVAPDEQERDVRLPYAVAISTGTLVAMLLFG